MEVAGRGTGRLGCDFLGWRPVAPRLWGGGGLGRWSTRGACVCVEFLGLVRNGVKGATSAPTAVRDGSPECESTERGPDQSPDEPQALGLIEAPSFGWSPSQRS